MQERSAQSSRVTYGVDHLLADEQWEYDGAGHETLWALGDHLGTVHDLIDSSGKIRKHTAFDTFGNRMDEQYWDSSGNTVTAADPAAVDTLFGFTGRPLDETTGLQNNLNRWYDSKAGKWISEDPIGFAGGDSNLGRYVENGATEATDPSGLLTWEDYWVGLKAGTHEFFVGQIYGRGKAVATGEAGRALGNRVVGIVETQTRQPFSGTAGEYCRFGRGIAGDITGVNPLVEAAYSVDISDERELTSRERLERGLGGTAALAATAAGGLTAAGRVSAVMRPATLSNVELVEGVALRAERWGVRHNLENGGRAGALKHGYADRLLTRFQRRFGDRGLSTEVRYCQQRLWRPGDGLRGTVRLDVVERPLTNPTAVFGYKFGTATLTPSRIMTIRTVSGIGSDVPIILVTP